LEVVVVVDGPDAETVERLAQIQDPRLRVLSLLESVGGSEARNVGARNARSPWIALLDDDDEWMPAKIEKQLGVAESAGSERVVAVSQYVHRAPGQTDVLWPRRLPKAGEAVPEYMFDFLCYFQTSTFFCSRQLFLDLPFRKGQKGFQDIEWFLRVNSDPATKLVVIAEPLSVYHAPGGRATITGSLSWEERLAWGMQHRHLMTRRAYSRFIVGSCAGPAVQQGGGYRAFFRLLRECIVRSSVTPKSLGILIATFSITPAFRRYIRDSFFLQNPKLGCELEAS
jgi:glycosyltransferase involved in cell wall biosynthesis